jgi:hypothetical protein
MVRACTDCQAMFVDAFFHADCHGGNLLWMPARDGATAAMDGVSTAEQAEAKGTKEAEETEDAEVASGALCILDCGLMVEIDPSAADGLLRLSLHLAGRQWAAVVDDAIQLGFLPPQITPQQRASAQGIARCGPPDEFSRGVLEAVRRPRGCVALRLTACVAAGSHARVVPHQCALWSIRVSSRLVGPYLDVGGGASAASVYSASELLRDVRAASAELPTALPPAMVLLGRVRCRASIRSSQRPDASFTRVLTARRGPCRLTTHTGSCFWADLIS